MIKNFIEYFIRSDTGIFTKSKMEARAVGTIATPIYLCKQDRATMTERM
jgi:hypothetical protein